MQVDEYKAWLNKAEDNIKWAKDNLKEENYPLVCFLSQQAVELALKGFLYKNEVVSPKVHNLIQISEVCKKTGLKLTNDADLGLNKLTDYYFETRYPDMLDMDLDDKKIAEEALKLSRNIVDSVKVQI